jgi:hypothetical protein
MKKSLLILITISIAYSCGTLSIEKRRYNRGFYVNWNKSSKQENKQETANNIIIIKDPVTDQANIDTARQLLAVSNEKETINDSKILTTRSESIEMNIDANHEHQKKNVKKDRDSAPIRMKATQSYDKVRLSQHLDIKQKPSTISSNWFYTIFTTLPLMFIFRKRVSRIARWSSENKKQSQILIASLIGISGMSSFALGTLLGSSTNGTSALTSIGVFALAGLLNSLRLNSGLNFLKNKFSFALFGISGAFTFYGLGVKYGSSVLLSSGNDGGELAIHPALVILFTLLLVAALILVIGLIASLACNIACYGSEALAAVVFLGGTFLAVMFFAYAIQYVFRKKDQPTDAFWKNAALAGLFIILFILLLALASGTL